MKLSIFQLAVGAAAIAVSTSTGFGAADAAFHGSSTSVKRGFRPRAQVALSEVEPAAVFQESAKEATAPLENSSADRKAEESGNVRGDPVPDLTVTRDPDNGDPLKSRLSDVLFKQSGAMLASADYTAPTASPPSSPGGSASNSYSLIPHNTKADLRAVGTVIDDLEDKFNDVSDFLGCRADFKGKTDPKGPTVAKVLSDLEQYVGTATQAGISNAAPGGSNTLSSEVAKIKSSIGGDFSSSSTVSKAVSDLLIKITTVEQSCKEVDVKALSEKVTVIEKKLVGVGATETVVDKIKEVSDKLGSTFTSTKTVSSEVELIRTDITTINVKLGGPGDFSSTNTVKKRIDDVDNKFGSGIKAESGFTVSDRLDKIESRIGDTSKITSKPGETVADRVGDLGTRLIAIEGKLGVTADFSTTKTVKDEISRLESYFGEDINGVKPKRVSDKLAEINGKLGTCPFGTGATVSDQLKSLTDGLKSLSDKLPASDFSRETVSATIIRKIDEKMGSKFTGNVADNLAALDAKIKALSDKIGSSSDLSKDIAAIREALGDGFSKTNSVKTVTDGLRRDINSILQPTYTKAGDPDTIVVPNALGDAIRAIIKQELAPKGNVVTKKGGSIFQAVTGCSQSTTRNKIYEVLDDLYPSREKVSAQLKILTEAFSTSSGKGREYYFLEAGQAPIRNSGLRAIEPPSSHKE